MTVLESMKDILTYTGLYQLTGKTMVDAELAVYATELDALREAFEELERESFAATACGKGLLTREAVFGLNGEGKSKEERRKAVLGRGAVTSNSFSRAEVEQTLCSEGLRVEIHENTAEQKICINFLDEMTDPGDRLTALFTVERFLPAHLDAELDFRNLSWNTIDQTNRSFDELDAKDLPWNSIDNFQKAMVPLSFI